MSSPSPSPSIDTGTSTDRELAVVSVLVDSLRQERKQQGRLGWLIVGFGVISSISSFKIKDGSLAGILAISLVAIAIGAAIVARSRRNVGSDPTLLRLATRPQELIWFYLKPIRRSGSGGTTHLWLQFIDGARKAFSLSASQEPRAQSQLAALCPKALVGYSQEREAAFAKDPRSMSSL